MSRLTSENSTGLGGALLNNQHKEMFLIRAKTVSVSAMPAGKTKLFPGIRLSDATTLVDCPRLVFPNFATTRAESVCADVWPIDSLGDYSGPAAPVAKRKLKNYLEAVDGISIDTRPEEQGGNGVPTSEELLGAYALCEGFTKTSQGNPDVSRAARFILKDYVASKLPYVQSPPNIVSGADFNAELYVLAGVPKKAPISRVPSTASIYIRRAPAYGTHQTHQLHSNWQCQLISSVSHNHARHNHFDHVRIMR